MSTTHTTFFHRRSLLMLLSAGLILVVSIVWRMTTSVIQSQQAAQQAATRLQPIERGSQAAVEMFQGRVQKAPEDAAGYAQLGLSLLQQVRESGDATLYAKSQQALDQALQHDPKQVDALVGQGVLALALHNFQDALKWAAEALPLNPYRSEIVGIQVDGLVELGRYPEAVEALQKMVDLRPDLHSYSRISYLRELHGDVEGAIEAMRMAVESSQSGQESWRWTLTHLGHLYFNKGDLASAEMIYQQVLSQRADYSYALAGLARVQAAQGNLSAAIATLQPVAERMPLPEFLNQLGEFYEAAGNDKAAYEQYDLVGVIQQLFASNGMNVDLELALFTANHGSKIGIRPEQALQQARAAYAERPTIYAADTLAWALYQTGNYQEAQKYSTEALRLQTQDAILFYHAGLIANALGDPAAAKAQLQKALTINPHFSLLYAPTAQKILKEIQ